MSTWPFWMNGSRLAETVSVQVMFSASMPSFAAMSLAISTSKPSGSSVCGFSRPKPGWSILVPTVIFPASFSRAIVVPGVEADVGLDGGGVLRRVLGLVAGLAGTAGQEEAGGRRDGGVAGDAHG